MSTSSIPGTVEREDPPRLGAITARGNDALGGMTVVERSISDLLRVVREVLDLEVVFVGEFKAGQRIFRHICAGSDQPPIKVGEAHPLDLTLCARVADGRFPAVAHDVRAMVASHGLAPIFNGMGGHIGVPVRYEDGTLYGMLCGFSTRPCPQLAARDLKRLEIAAQAAARLLAQAEGHDITVPSASVPTAG